MSRVLPYNAKQWEVQAILEGRKNSYRKVCKDGNEFTVPDASYMDFDKRTYAVHNYADSEHTDKLSIAERTMPILPGDILYVRETWQLDPTGFEELPPEYWWKYKASHELPSSCTRWRPSIHMPKEAARIWLKVTDVRIERLQDICKDWSQFDKEGIIEEHGFRSEMHQQYKALWDSTVNREEYKWVSNPWVWVIEFERCERPEVDDG